jgi:membrane fusion protein (multidrug efflux system)
VSRSPDDSWFEAHCGGGGAGRRAGSGRLLRLALYDRSRDIQTTNDAYVRGEITDLSSRVSGYAVEVLLDDGMPVKTTDVLVRIDLRDFRMGVEKAEAALNQAKADMAAVVASRELGKSKVAVAEAALRSAGAQAKNSDATLTRAAILAKDRFGTQAALDYA